MISYSFEHSEPWAAVVGSATPSWPTALNPWTGSPAEPSVRAWFGHTPVPGGLPVPSSPDCTAAMVVGREPMTADRLSTWMRRVVLPIAADADLAALTAWQTAEQIHRVVLPPDASAPRLARSTVHDIVGDARQLDDVVLAVSELTANAVMHGSGPIELAVHHSADAITVQVSDEEVTRHPEVRRASMSSITGRGLSIIDAVAAHWGLTVRDASKSVWCEFAR